MDAGGLAGMGKSKSSRASVAADDSAGQRPGDEPSEPTSWGGDVRLAKGVMGDPDEANRDELEVEPRVRGRRCKGSCANTGIGSCCSVARVDRDRSAFIQAEEGSKRQTHVDDVLAEKHLPEGLVNLLEAHARAALANDDAQPDLLVVGDGVVELEQARLAIDEMPPTLRVEEGEPELLGDER